MPLVRHPEKNETKQRNYNVLYFLFEERLFSLIVDLNKTVLAAFIMHLVRHPEKTKLNNETTMCCISYLKKDCLV